MWGCKCDECSAAYAAVNAKNKQRARKQRQAAGKKGNDVATPTRTYSGEDLIRRCQKQKFEQSEPSSGIEGVQFQMPDGSTFVVRETYNSARSLKIAEEELLSRGLEDAERAQERSQQVLEQNGLLEGGNGRKKAPGIPVFSAASNDALRRAAGNYLTEPKDVGIEYFAYPHPAPLFEWVYVTPEIAKYLLQNHNKPGAAGEPGTNRPQSEKRIEYYRDTIVSGQWHLTHQGMAMDTDLKVQDGQHRLAAIEAAGELVEDLKVPVAFFVGMPVENFAAIDDVLLRTAAQLFTMKGEANGATLQAATRMVIAHSSNNVRNKMREKVTNLDVLAMFDKSGVEQMRRSAQAANVMASKVKMSKAAFAAAHFLISQVHEEGNRFIDAFFEGLTTGRKAGTRLVLDDDDPRYILRKTMMDLAERKRKPRPVDQLGMLLMTWNNVAQGLHPRYLKFTPNETEIPRVVQCHDSGENASLTPRALEGEIRDEEFAENEGADD